MRHSSHPTQRSARPVSTGAIRADCPHPSVSERVDPHRICLTARRRRVHRWSATRFGPVRRQGLCVVAPRAVTGFDITTWRPPMDSGSDEVVRVNLDPEFRAAVEALRHRLRHDHQRDHASCIRRNVFSPAVGIGARCVRRCGRGSPAPLPRTSSRRRRWRSGRSADWWFACGSRRRFARRTCR